MESSQIAEEHPQCPSGLDPDFHQFLAALVEERTSAQARSHDHATLVTPFHSTSKSDLTAVHPVPEAAQEPEHRPSAALPGRGSCQAACASSSNSTTEPIKNAYAASIAQLLKTFGKHAPSRSRQQPHASLEPRPQLREESQPGQTFFRSISAGQTDQIGSARGVVTQAASHVNSKTIKGSGKRTNAWILKNRRAQQRHRAKERDHRSELQQQLIEMTKQLKALQTQRSELTSHTSVLEKTLATQQHHLDILDSADSAVDCSTAFSHKTPKLLPVAESALSQQAGQSSGTRESHETIIFTQRQILDLPFDAAKQLTRAHEMDVFAAREEIIGSLQKVLVSLDADSGNKELYAKLQRQLTHVGNFNRSAIQSNPQNLRKVLFRDKADRRDEAGLIFRCHTDWQSVTDTLSFAVEQKAAIVQVLLDFRRKNQRVKLDLQMLYQAIAQGAEEDMQDTPAGQSLQRDQQLLRQLNSALVQDTTAWITFVLTLFHEVMTPVQYARLNILSSPHNCDPMAVATCVFEEMKAQGLTAGQDLQHLAALAPAFRTQALLNCK